MMHTLILTVLLYAIVRASLRGRQPDPMVGRLVSRDPALTRPMHEVMILQQAACDDLVRPNNLFESPAQAQARTLRVKVAAPI